jgi:threonyl-tRNA synthetase
MRVRARWQVQLINSKIPDGGSTTAYRCGPLIDLCPGPHVPNTAVIKAFEVLKSSSSYWLGTVENDTLQRVYGTRTESSTLPHACS